MPGLAVINPILAVGDDADLVHFVDRLRHYGRVHRSSDRPTDGRAVSVQAQRRRGRLSEQ